MIFTCTAASILRKTTLAIAHKFPRFAPIRRGCTTVSNGLVHVTSGNIAAKYNPTWLRENCQCAECYTHATKQRSVLFHKADSQVSSANGDGEKLHIQWKDGHKSVYELAWLEEKSKPKSPPPVSLWTAAQVEKSQVQAVNYDSFMASDDGVRSLLENVWKYGFGLVSGTPVSDEAMEMVKRVSFVQETFFGTFWKFTADLARGDTAYTNVELGAHTDTTYLSNPAGIQVFHCLEHDGTGGETLLVDGFNAAQILRRQNPDAFRLLASTPVLHQYIEPAVHTQSQHNILNVDPWDEQRLQSIRYNHYDRAEFPPAAAQEHLAAFYSALEELSGLIEAPAHQHWLKLRPGTVLFVDNWRVLHGRAAFTGRRSIIGCYLPRDDWLSRARQLGVL